MFDRSVDAFMSGHYRVVIDVKETPDGFHATWEGPRGQKLEATNTSSASAQTDVVNQLRDGILSRQITLDT